MTGRRRPRLSIDHLLAQPGNPIAPARGSARRRVLEPDAAASDSGDLQAVEEMSERKWIVEWARRVLSRHPGMVDRLHRFADRHPRAHRLLWTPARLVWWTVSLQLPRRIAAEWTKPRRAPRVDERRRFRLRPLVANTARPRGGEGRRRLICVTHVLPHPPRAGNEYRIARMLAWLARQDWEVLLVVCPLADEDMSDDDVAQAAAMFSNLIVSRRDGTLLHHLSCDGALLQKLDGRRPRDFTAMLDQDPHGDGRSRRTRDILRMYSPDRLVELLLHLERRFDPDVLLAEYVFTTRSFPLLRPSVRKVIDTIDVFSNKQDKVERFGIDDFWTMTKREEALLLGRADLLIAIQADEAADLRALVPGVPVVSVGVDFDVVDVAPAPAAAPVILLIGSDNKMNVKGLQDFLRFAWPLVRRDVPGVELHVAGSVGASAEAWSPDIRILGRVDDLDAAYAQARVVINPAVAGTGLKIKTVEALCHFRPIVVWPSGIEGIASEARTNCHVATDWFDFAQRVVHLVRRPHDGEASAQHRQEMIRQFSPDRVYAPLADALRAGHSIEDGGATATNVSGARA
jgi:hypothetical protein